MLRGCSAVCFVIVDADDEGRSEDRLQRACDVIRVSSCALDSSTSLQVTLASSRSKAKAACDAFALGGEAQLLRELEREVLLASRKEPPSVDVALRRAALALRSRGGDGAIVLLPLGGCNGLDSVGCPRAPLRLHAVSVAGSLSEALRAACNCCIELDGDMSALIRSRLLPALRFSAYSVRSQWEALFSSTPLPFAFTGRRAVNAAPPSETSGGAMPSRRGGVARACPSEAARSLAVGSLLAPPAIAAAFAAAPLSITVAVPLALLPPGIEAEHADGTTAVVVPARLFASALAALTRPLTSVAAARSLVLPAGLAAPDGLCTPDQHHTRSGGRLALWLRPDDILELRYERRAGPARHAVSEVIARTRVGEAVPAVALWAADPSGRTFSVSAAGGRKYFWLSAPDAEAAQRQLRALGALMASPPSLAEACGASPAMLQVMGMALLATLAAPQPPAPAQAPRRREATSPTQMQPATQPAPAGGGGGREGGGPRAAQTASAWCVGIAGGDKQHSNQPAEHASLPPPPPATPPPPRDAARPRRIDLQSLKAVLSRPETDVEEE